MRLWTVHPKYLDGVGLVALWREALLARLVLKGGTRGYRHHPQLIRFKAQPQPVRALNQYLETLYAESQRRGYRFDRRKLGRLGSTRRISETTGQLAAEWEHLLRKLRQRQPAHFRQLVTLARPEAHPLFRIVPGAVRTWERGRAATD